MDNQGCGGSQVWSGCPPSAGPSCALTIACTGGYTGVHSEMNWVNQRFPDDAAAERLKLAYPKTVEEEVKLLRMAVYNFHK